MITQFNGDEDTALQGIPLAAQLLYLRGIRPFMDYQTGIVGIKRKISLNGLTDILHVEAHQGCKEERHSKQQVRRLLEWLIRSGLLERRSIERESLIFFLPMADKNKSVQKKADTKPTQSRHFDGDTDEAAYLLGLSEIADTKPTQGKTEIADTHQYNGITDNLKHNLSITSKVVGDLSGAEICKVWREMGLMHTNPGHADLLALIEAGAGMRHFVHGASEAINRGANFNYALKCTLTAFQKPEAINVKKTRIEVDTGFTERYADL